MYLRGRWYWWRGTVAGRERRKSLGTTDPAVARMLVTRVERLAAIEEMLKSDTALRSQLRDALLGESIGWVYFARSDGLVKIGFSRHLAGRLANLQTHSVHEVVLLKKVRGTMADEKAWHRRFANLRVRGEWFRVTPRLLAAIKSARRGRA
jgi:hypothetical protein